MLLAAIEKKREQMINIAKVYGLTSKQVLKVSQELDQMIDLYQAQNQNRYKRPNNRFVLYPKNGSEFKKQPLKKAQ